jgi:hypothetical protein
MILATEQKRLYYKDLLYLFYSKYYYKLKILFKEIFHGERKKKTKSNSSYNKQYITKSKYLKYSSTLKKR